MYYLTFSVLTAFLTVQMHIEPRRPELSRQLIIKPGSIQAKIFYNTKWKKDERAWRTTVEKEMESDLPQMDMQLYNQ